MPKATLVPSLNLSGTHKDGQFALSPGALSPRSTDSPRSPRSNPVSPGIPLDDQQSALPTRMDSKDGREGSQTYDNERLSPRVTAVPEFPHSPGPGSPKQHTRDTSTSKSFFSNFIATKSSHKLNTNDSNMLDPVGKTNGQSRTSSKDRTQHALKKQSSTSDLPRIMSNNNYSSQDSQLDQSGLQVPPGSSDGAAKQRNRSKLGGILTRTKSNRPEDEKKTKTRGPAQLSLEIQSPQSGEPDQHAPLIQTAPIKSNHREQAFAAETGSMSRNRSADRAGVEDQTRNGHLHSNSATGTSREGPSLLANIQHTGRGVGDRLGKAGRGLFSKMTRTGSTTEREPITDENYVCSTINLPLIKQTRKTRIAKRLELSRDKTEYWMPALPWRCIDYLNMQCEQEGLYRVPGSGRDVKFWQRRFDIEHDIDLFEEPELYDVNTIASMFKAWLRDLPDELFPRTIQSRISQQCAGAQKPPQMLKDELSKLPPFNYYLLFAITCHLSLLHSYADQNKMDYRNLCICFQPCLKIDAFCFQFLVIDWKECWQQGCLTEKEFLEEEHRYEREGSINDPKESADERAVSSSGSSAYAQHAQPSMNADAFSKSMTVPTMPKQRSLSSTTPAAPRIPINHGHTQTAPTVPSVVNVSQTPEHKPITDASLPELGNLSPIRM